LKSALEVAALAKSGGLRPTHAAENLFASRTGEDTAAAVVPASLDPASQAR